MSEASRRAAEKIASGVANDTFATPDHYRVARIADAMEQWAARAVAEKNEELKKWIFDHRQDCYVAREVVRAVEEERERIRKQDEEIDTLKHRLYELTGEPQ